MTNKQICEYIKHYVEEDRTKSAIMLTAPWGKGKSYFVQNELIPYLEQPHKISTITGTSKPVTTVRRSNGSKRLV